jgi:peptide chain release factor 1
MTKYMEIPNYLKPQLDEIDQKIRKTQEMLNDPELSDVAKEEIKALEQQKEVLIDTVNNINNDHQEENISGQIQSNNAILEIRGAAGGEEAKIWGLDLLRMYIRFAENQGWKTEFLDELSIKIKGKGVYEALQFESGVHRVQRVPVTEKNGRIHTSTATVAVLPIIPPSQIEIRAEDLDWEFSRAGGHGGQNVNKVSTAVRLIHKPTGLVVSCRQERTQMQNRDIALELLRSRLWEMEEEKRFNQITDQRANAVGRGMRSEKIRTYNYPQNRVTDHRISKSWYELENIVNGDLNKVFEALKES